jgi:hypothetical protein
MRESVRTFLRPKRRRRLVLAAVAVSALAVAVPVALATFTDVPPDNPFYADINAIQGAGITQGCGGGNFCPTDNITRQAEAAFQHRGLPRVALGSQTTSSFAGGSSGATIGQVSITVPGVGGNQFVRVDGSATLYDFGSDCPCYATTSLGESTGGVPATSYAEGDASGYNQITIPVSWVFSATPGTHTYNLYGSVSTADTVGVASVQLIAQTMPFGSTGAGTLNVTAHAAPGKDNRPPAP